ncbi:MAG: ParA family protein [Calditrichaeota bacterium]|nr:MAG: ParA family protein [Calditrichota bacterium]
MVRTIAVFNLKGGVGKTTLAVNLGAALQLMGKRVLLVDLDPQHDLTMYLGVNPAQLKGVEYFITRDLKFAEIVRSYNHRFDFLPSGKKLRDLEDLMSALYVNYKKMNFLIRDAFLHIEQQYDYIIFDCPPAGGQLTINALSYVQDVFLPVQCQFLALRGSKKALFLIYRVKTLFNPALRLGAVIPVMYDPRNRLSSVIVEKLHNAYGDYLTDTKIRINVSLAEAPGFGKTIFDYKPFSRGAQDFKKLAREVAEMPAGELRLEQSLSHLVDSSVQHVMAGLRANNA